MQMTCEAGSCCVSGFVLKSPNISEAEMFYRGEKRFKDKVQGCGGE